MAALLKKVDSDTTQRAAQWKENADGIVYHQVDVFINAAANEVKGEGWGRVLTFNL